MTYEPRNKECLFLSGEVTFQLKLLESAILSPQWPDVLKKYQVKISQFLPLKSILYLINCIFQLTAIVILMGVKTFYRVKFSDY